MTPQQGRLLSASAHVQWAPRKDERKIQQSNWCFLLLRRGRPSLSTCSITGHQGKMRASSSQYAAGTKTQQSKRDLHATTKYVAISHFKILSLNQKPFYSVMSPTLLNNASPSMSPTFLNDVSPSDEKQEHGLFTQPEAEAIDLTVESDPPSARPPLKVKPPTRRSSIVTSPTPTWMPS